MEYFDNTGNAVAKLSWELPNISGPNNSIVTNIFVPKQVVPKKQLFPTAP